MSSSLNFFLRQHGVLHHAVISSGGLSCVFDPSLFEGDAEVIDGYIKSMGDGPTSSFSPMDSGLLVIDIDQKKIWNLQVARELDSLSRNFDHSWINLNRLHKLKWLGKGLVDPETRAVVAPYPKGVFRPGWYDEQCDLAKKSFQETHPEMNWAKPKTREYIAMAQAQPRIPFAPLGWTFMNLDDDFGNVERHREGLIADGFPITADDFPAWDRWTEGMKKREGW